MEVSYTLAEGDFSTAFYTHYRHVTLRRWYVLVLIGFIGLMLIFGLISLIARPSVDTVASIAPLVMLVAIWVLVFLGLPKISARRQFRGQPGAQGAKTAILDSTGVHWRWQGGSSDAEWGMFVRWLESKDLFLLYTSPVCFNVIPKRAMTPQQTEEARALMTSNIRFRK